MFPREHHGLGAFPSGGQGGHLCLSCHRLTSQVFSLSDAVFPFPPPAHWFSKNGDTISKPPTAGPDATVPVCCVYGTGNRASSLEGCFLQPRPLLLCGPAMADKSSVGSETLEGNPLPRFWERTHLLQGPPSATQVQD